MNLLVTRKRAIARKKRKIRIKEEKMKRKLRKYLIKEAKKGATECTLSDCDIWWDNTLSHKEGLELLEELNEKFKGQILFESRYSTFSGRVKIKEVEQQCEK